MHLAIQCLPNVGEQIVARSSRKPDRGRIFTTQKTQHYYTSRQLAAQGIDLAQTRTQAEALAASAEALERRIDDEKASHEKTRRMLAEALVGKSAAKSDASVRRRRKP